VAPRNTTSLVAPTVTAIFGIGVMFSDCVPAAPSMVAVTTTLPVVTPCSTPAAEIVATAGFELDHVAVVSGTTAPEASSAAISGGDAVTK